MPISANWPARSQRVVTQRGQILRSGSRRERFDDHVAMSETGPTATVVLTVRGYFAKIAFTSFKVTP